MAYYSNHELSLMGFKHIGSNVKVSNKAIFYDCERIEIGDNSRIDDLCLISGKVKIGNYCHVTPMCLLAGGEPGLELKSFVTLAYGVKIFTQSDDYSGITMTNSQIPKKYKKEIKAPVLLEKFVIVGANSTIMPNTTLSEGCSIGAMSLVLRDTAAWGVYFGVPAKRVKDRKREMLKLAEQFIKESNSNDTF